jgi:lysophospholipase L1-like esterase
MAFRAGNTAFRAGKTAFRSGNIVFRVAGVLLVLVLVPASTVVRPAAATVAGTTVGAAAPQVYVSLGDSYTAGPFVPGPDMKSGGCLRSGRNYPSLVASALHPASFTDVSCYGARTADMTASQSILGGTNPPQLNALSPVDTLVTLQIGGNDLGFNHITLTCALLSLTDPFGSPCQDHYEAGGTNQLALSIARIAPKVGAVLAGIHARAPHARVLLVGYPDILPSGAGCWPEEPIARGDVPYLRDVEILANRALAVEAARNGATYVDTFTDSVGHDACRPPGVKWVEGLIPTSLAAPFHPNELGEEAMARQVIATVG